MLRKSKTEMDHTIITDGEMSHQVNHHLLKLEILDVVKLNQEFMTMLRICLSQSKREEEKHHIHTMGGQINLQVDLHWHKNKILLEKITWTLMFINLQTEQLVDHIIVKIKPDLEI